MQIEFNRRYITKIRFNHNLTTVVKSQIKQRVDMKLYYLI